MAKSDKPLEEIDLSRAYTPPHKAAWSEDKSINGFDTETSDGTIFTVSIAWDGYGGKNEHNNQKALTAKQLWDVLTHKRARSSLNMWYNLDFDANVLLNQVLDKESLAELTVSGHTKTENYEITYIRTKFLEIKDNNRNVYTHYDAAQFFYTSLENAVSEWLNQTKANETIEAALFGSNSPSQMREIIENSSVHSWEDLPINPGQAWTLDHAKEYIDKNWKDILKYARKDAELVRDLWKKAVSVGEDLEIPMGRPFSTGYLAESYLNEHMKEKPGMGPRPMTKLAWDAYAGGRFEVIKRGKIGRVCGPDINSAYPYQLSKLPDPKTLTWKKVGKPTIEGIKNADYGFIKAKISTDPNRPIQPFAIKDESQDKLIYPALEEKEITCIKEIFIHAYENGYITSVDFEDCWLGYDTGNVWYPFGFIDPLYESRQEAKARGESQRELWLKIILNSMYGKMCQTTPKREEVTEEKQLSEKEKYVPELSLPKMIREKYKNGFVERLEAGAWFNPFLASYITGLTRLELHKRVLEYGLESHTVMLATDCLMIEEKPFKNSNFQTDLVKDGLGNWDMEYEGHAFVIGAGVYQIDFDNGKSPKVKTRGFRETDLDMDLRKAAEKANGKIAIESNRPKTVAEVIWSNDELGQVGKFLDHSREITADMDTKRKWDSAATFQGITTETQNSKPIVISD